jgi:cell division protein ZapA (FtsZ GTPase activity inhibitor)
MRFLDYLEEQKEKHAVLAFGRMNPPTIGHSLVVDKVKDVAKTFGASHHIVLSHSQDKSKNPLSAEQKVKHAKRFFPKTNITVATKEEPNFLTQAAKLHKQGVTHLHMVAGSDRTDEYYKLLHKYNGTHKGALFNFRHIKVHSAGERDPDAEGTTGMSASKMRSHASEGNFNKFKQGIPKHVKPEHAKELYNHVRQGMGIKESIIDDEFNELLIEGVHDKGIFKAVFLGGGPGSGKDYVLDKTMSGHGLVEINSDKALEFLMDKNNLDMRMPDNQTAARDVVRGKAKSMTELKQRLALFGRNGLIINGTGDDPEKIKKIKERLESLGYDTSMVMVNTADEVSRQRNVERGQRGGRTVPEDIRKQKWDAVQSARVEYGKLFKDKYAEFDNSEDLRSADPEVAKQKESELMDLYKGVQKFIKQPPKNPSAQSWVASELEKKDKLPVKKTGSELAPHPNSGAAEEARKLGLQYYGFGRYGTKGTVTYRSVHDKLVQVNKQEPSNLKMPVPGTSMKKIKESIGLMAESITVSITADTPEELNQAFSNLFNKTEEVQKESSHLSNDDAKNMLTLGMKYEVSDINQEGFTLSNSDITNILESKYITDGHGKPRIFMLRRAAAKEAHQKNGTIVPHTNGGYVVKLNEENQNVSISKEPVQEETGSSGRYLIESTDGRSQARFSSEEKTNCSQSNNKAKISIEKIRAKQKEKYQESIDKGIEPGLSMAGAGESIGRDMGEKIKKGKLGKASPIAELTGDSTTLSIGDQKEDELKKKGINLSSFKAKKFIG